MSISIPTVEVLQVPFSGVLALIADICQVSVCPSVCILVAIYNSLFVRLKYVYEIVIIMVVISNLQESWDTNCNTFGYYS